MDIKDIYWLAGILEGEGHFGYYSAPRIHLKMTDFDTVFRAKTIMNVNVSIGRQNRNGWKTAHVLAVNSHQAVGWMMTLYSIMSTRRKSEIRAVLSKWRNANSHNGFTTTTGKKLIHMIARKHGISAHEAKSRLYDGEYVTGPDGRTYIGSAPKKKLKIEILNSKPFTNPFQERVDFRSSLCQVP